MTTFTYFAYGSNMLTERLVARCPGAVPLGTAAALDHAVGFWLKSEDGSSKKAIIRAPGRQAYGVVFSVPLRERDILDGFEGCPGVYARDDAFGVTMRESGERRTVTTYVPQPALLVDNMQPYAWYLALCVGGAVQHGLPEDYIRGLRAVVARPMKTELVRAMQGEALALSALAAAGYGALAGELG